MPHFYERNIVKVNSEYVTFLTDIITPLIYEGILSIYNDSIEIEKKLIEKSKIDPSIEPHGILKLFQSCLKEVPNYNKNILSREANRIKNSSKCYDWFDDLVKATIKSHILLLTCSSKTKKSESLDTKHYENIDTEDFLHKCYIESAKLFYNNPELFWHDLKPIKAKRNQKMIIDMIRKSIESAIRKSLPMKIILEDFLNNDPYDEEYVDINPFIPVSRINDMKTRVNNDINNIPGEYNMQGGDIRTSENGFEEMGDNNMLSDDHMEDIQDRISKLGEAIEKNLGEHKTKSKSESNKSCSQNSQEIRDIVNDSIKRVGNIVDNHNEHNHNKHNHNEHNHNKHNHNEHNHNEHNTHNNLSKMHLKSPIQLDSIDKLENIIEANTKKIISSSRSSEIDNLNSSNSSNNSNSSNDMIISEGSNDSNNKLSSSDSSKSSNSSKSSSDSKSKKHSYKKHHKTVSTEKSNFFANYLDD